VIRAAGTALALGVLLAAPALAQTARERYESALEREQDVRTRLAALEPGVSAPSPTVLITDALRTVTAFESLVRRFPVSGYADNALWQGAGLAETLYGRFARHDDRNRALRLYRWLIQEYPQSPLVRRAASAAAALEAAGAAADEVPSAAAADVETTASAPVSGPAATPPPAPAAPAERAMLLDIARSVLPETVRVTLELSREVPYREDRISGPARVFFDLRGVQLTPALLDKVLTYSDDVVRQIRVGRHPESTVRVVLDQEGVKRHSVFTLYNPFRIVIDSERTTPIAVAQPRVTAPVQTIADELPVIVREPVSPPAAVSGPARPDAPAAPPAADSPAPGAPPAAAPLPAPAPPAANAAGGFSLSRQLGLSVSRIVIDPGHGGRDPGARGQGIKEADLTLDVALRLEKLLQAEAGIEVVLTRRTDVYVPLEERTAIANREGADLFLSIHANASRNAAAHGVETYFLSFATTPEAEAVAARENSASERTMHNLPDIIRAIALNNKLDESRDLAAMVQEALVTRLRRGNRTLRNLGVKKAPFVVLIGAGMPSVLAEMAFLTNKQEAQLLKTPAYKQRIAESLHAAILKYRSSLKKIGQVADR
jgi:N-acetylmuramoyl-L-alanine amidase